MELPLNPSTWVNLSSLRSQRVCNPTPRFTIFKYKIEKTYVDFTTIDVTSGTSSAYLTHKWEFILNNENAQP